MRRPAATVSAALLTLATLTACMSGPSDTGDPTAGGTPDQGASILAPGEPGEENGTVSEDEIVPEDKVSESDVAFVQMMIPHHAQAIVMSDLAADHAQDRRVKVMADRIRAAQGPEIIAMAAWLEERNLDVPAAADDPEEWDHSQHGHDGMHGMLTEKQLAQLAEARGAAFDRLFLRRMIGHHEGAITMADDALPASLDVRAGEMMSEVGAVQAGEILRMRDLLDELA